MEIRKSETRPSLHNHVRFRFEREGLWFYADKENHVATLYSRGREADFLAGLELTLSLACQDLGGLSVHGAAAAVNGVGYLMPGVSGTGKSTAIRGGGFEKTIADERVFLLPSSGRWLMVSTPFWSSGRSVIPNPSASLLDAILILEKGLSLELTTESSANSLQYFLRNVVYYGIEESTRRDLFLTAADVVSNVDSFRLSFPKRGPWAWTVNQMHFKVLSIRSEQNTSR